MHPLAALGPALSPTQGPVLTTELRAEAELHELRRAAALEDSGEQCAAMLQLRERWRLSQEYDPADLAAVQSLMHRARVY